MIKLPSPQPLLALCLLIFSISAHGSPCRDETFERIGYIVCSFDAGETNIRMYWRNGAGEPYRTFSALADDIAEQELELVFAMNGGMYQADYTPLGHYVEDGNTLRPVNTTTLSGNTGQIPNFYKKPNGIFFIADGRAGVLETDAFLAAEPDVRYATQSGPMLVVDGQIHPDFIAGSTAIRPRNGVCASSPTEVHFVMTRTFVNFHSFARFFRDHLGCDNALYLDGGTAPGLYSPDLNRNDPPGHGGYGPIIAVVKQNQ